MNKRPRQRGLSDWLLASFAALMVCCCSFDAAAQQAPQDDTQSWNEVQITVPLKKKIDLVASGQLRLGRDITGFVDERGGMGLVFKVHKYLSLSPSYTHIATQPIPQRRAFENRLNFAATVTIPAGKFTFTDRNLFERRIRSPANSTRYRNRLQVARPINDSWSWFLSEEVFYDWSVDEWVRNRVAGGLSKKLNKTFTGDVYYLRQNDGRSRPGDLHVIGTTLRVRL